MTDYVGLDIHKKYCHATAMDESGDILFREKFSSEPEEFENLTARVGDDAEVAIEAAYAWQYVYEQLEDKVGEVKLAHPKRTRIITDERIKTDARASEALAQLMRTGWLPKLGFRRRRSECCRRSSGVERIWSGRELDSKTRLVPS